MRTAVWTGMIALMGVDAQTGVFMLLYLDLAHEAARKSGRLRSLAYLRQAVLHGAAKRIRPEVHDRIRDDHRASPDSLVDGRRRRLDEANRDSHGRGSDNFVPDGIAGVSGSLHDLETARPIVRSRVRFEPRGANGRRARGRPTSPVVIAATKYRQCQK